MPYFDSRFKKFLHTLPDFCFLHPKKKKKKMSCHSPMFAQTASTSIEIYLVLITVKKTNYIKIKSTPCMLQT